MGGKGGWGGKFFLPHPNELLILADPENLVEITLIVKEIVKRGGGLGGGTGVKREWGVKNFFPHPIELLI